MATHSTIALEYDDGSVGQVYCHYDGYLSNNGRILAESYRDPSVVQALLVRGDMSSLDHLVDGCDFYVNRDGEPADVAQRIYPDWNAYIVDGQSEEFDYVLRKDGQWWVCCDELSRVWVTLDKAFRLLEVEVLK